MKLNTLYMKVSFCCIGPGTGAATADTSGLSAGAIAAIILAVLFILLAIIAIIICCCCAGNMLAKLFVFVIAFCKRDRSPRFTKLLFHL